MNENKTQRYHFYSALLKTIACTRNNSNDNLNYQEGVLEPAKAIREMEKSSNNEYVTENEIQQTFNCLKKIFRTKQTPEDEQIYFFQYIKEVSGISIHSINEV